MNRFFNWRCRSLLRGGILVLLSLGISIPLSDFPRNRPNPWISLFALVAIAGMTDHYIEDLRKKLA